MLMRLPQNYKHNNLTDANIGVCLVQYVIPLFYGSCFKFELNFCLRETMLELKELVTYGLYDPKTKTNIQVRVICCLGTVFKCEEIFIDKIISI